MFYTFREPQETTAAIKGEEASKQIYNFASAVQIKVLKGTRTIEEMTVGSESAGKPGWPAFPANKNAFLKQYGIAPGVTLLRWNLLPQNRKIRIERKADDETVKEEIFSRLQGEGSVSGYS